MVPPVARPGIAQGSPLVRFEHVVKVSVDICYTGSELIY